MYSRNPPFCLAHEDPRPSRPCGGQTWVVIAIARRSRSRSTSPSGPDPATSSGAESIPNYALVCDGCVVTASFYLATRSTTRRSNSCPSAQRACASISLSPKPAARAPRSRRRACARPGASAAGEVRDLGSPCPQRGASRHHAVAMNSGRRAQFGRRSRPPRRPRRGSARVPAQPHGPACHRAVGGRVHAGAGVVSARRRPPPARRRSVAQRRTKGRSAGNGAPRVILRTAPCAAVWVRGRRGAAYAGRP
jgi:hypothetical protein